jgi:hypothetical protein
MNAYLVLLLIISRPTSLLTFVVVSVFVVFIFSPNKLNDYHGPETDLFHSVKLKICSHNIFIQTIVNRKCFLTCTDVL